MAVTREFVFWVFAVAAVASALLCITRRSPVAAALWLVSTLFHLAGIFVLLEAHFIAAAQVLVYAGAIMVLFLFVIMLLNLGQTQASDIKGPFGRVIAGVAGLVLAAELLVLRNVEVPETIRAPATSMQETLAAEGAINAVAKPMFLAYLVPFEITSVMLLAAVVGAVVLAKRRL
jgi:NADH-quinone oxidoreductase subunit J